MIKMVLKEEFLAGAAGWIGVRRNQGQGNYKGSHCNNSHVDQGVL